MSELERRLKDEGEEILSVTVPADLEQRLTNRLATQPYKKIPRWKVPSLIAASLIFVLFFTYQFDTMAYYGKKILGFDNVLTDSLSELNDAGRGQPINQAAELPNGMKVTVNGLMLDENQLLIMYTVFDPDQQVEQKSSNYRIMLDSFFGQIHPISGYGKVNDDHTKMSFVQSFETPNPFAKHLNFTLEFDHQPNLHAEIPFELNRSKAMVTRYEKAINKTIKTDTATYNIRKITATPTQTVIKGKVEVTDKQAWDPDMVENKFSFNLEADGQQVPNEGSSFSSGLAGHTFEVQFNPLPAKEINELDLILDQALQVHNGKNKTNLKADHIQLNEYTLPIQDIKEQDGKTEVTVTALDTLNILKADLNGSKLDHTYNKSIYKTKAGIEKELVLVFNQTFEGKKTLTITKYASIEKTNQKIDIPMK